MISRRGLLLGLGALVAPAVVHYGNLMPVQSITRLITPEYLLRVVENNGKGAVKWVPLKKVLDRFLWQNDLGVGLVATHVRKAGTDEMTPINYNYRQEHLWIDERIHMLAHDTIDIRKAT
jgi:hypothetical protein